MMRRLSHTKGEDLKLAIQCVDCFLAIPGMKSEKSDREWAIETARTLYKKFPDHPAAQQTAMRLSAMDALEPGENEERYQTALYNKINRYFGKTLGLLHVRTQNDGRKIKIANHSVGYAKHMLERLHTSQTGETRDITAAALKEFTIATYIARCNDPGMTREEALKDVGRRQR